MTAPRLNRRLVLERSEQVADGSGGFATGWTGTATLWAEMTPRTGREMSQVGQTVARMSYRIVVRALPLASVARPRPGDRLTLGPRRFDIRAVAEHDAAGLYLACFADEEVSA